MVRGNTLGSKFRIGLKFRFAYDHYAADKKIAFEAYSSQYVKRLHFIDEYNLILATFLSASKSSVLFCFIRALVQLFS